MNDLEIAPTDSTPAVRALWAAGRLEMTGDSYPENSFELFQPVLDWLDRFLAESPLALSVELQLLYLNTSSVRAMMEIFDMLQEAHDGGREVKVGWRYDRANERVAELAAEFKEDYTFPFDIVPKA